MTFYCIWIWYCTSALSSSQPLQLPRPLCERPQSLRMPRLHEPHQVFEIFRGHICEPNGNILKDSFKPLYDTPLLFRRASEELNSAARTCSPILPPQPLYKTPIVEKVTATFDSNDGIAYSGRCQWQIIRVDCKCFQTDRAVGDFDSCM